jgi:hypothetical protein
MVVPANQEALAKYKKWQNVDKAQQMGIDDYLPSSNLSPHKKNSTTTTKKTWNSKPTDGNGRVDDWLGSPTKPKRSWKVKASKSPEQMAREAAEESDDDDETTEDAHSKQKPATVIIPNLEESDSESEQFEVESVAVSSVVTTPASSAVVVAAPKSVVSVKSTKSGKSTRTKTPVAVSSVVITPSPAVVVAAPRSVVSVKSVKSVPSTKSGKSSRTKTPKSLVLPPAVDEESTTQDNLVNQIVVVMDSGDDSESENGNFDDDGTEYHNHMKNKIGDFLDGNKYHSPGDASVMTEVSSVQRRSADVPDTLADNCLDNVILACCNLKAGMELFEQMTGLTKHSLRCTLRGVGTKSVRYHMSDRTFLEIMGPDDKQSSEPQSIGRGLLDIPDGTLVPYHYSVRNKPDQIEIPESLGWERDNLIMVHAETEDFDDNGEIAKWDFVCLYGHGLGGVVPSFVNWRKNKYHPSAKLEPQGAKIQSVEVQAPAGNYVHDLMRPVQGVTMSKGSTPMLTVSIVTPKGKVVSFSTANPEGIQMPGFGEEDDERMQRGNPAPVKPDLLPYGNRIKNY